MSPEFIWQLAGGVFFAGVVYGAIRGDLKMIHEKFKHNDEDHKAMRDDTAHVIRRLDDHMTWHASNK